MTLYDDSVESSDSTHSVVREWASRDFCSCHFQKGDEKDKDAIREYREEVKQDLQRSGITKIGKSPSHGRKGSKTYTKLTQAEMRQKRAQESTLKQIKSKQRKKDLAREKKGQRQIIFLNYVNVRI